MAAHRSSSRPAPSPEEVWSEAFQKLCERIVPLFARWETRQTAQVSLGGLTPSH